MQATDRETFATLMTGIAEMYGKPISAMGLKLWWSSLEFYEMDAVQGAMNRHVRHPDEGQFMPKPADIIRQIEGGGDERSLKAWTKVYDAICGVGSWTPLVFDDCRIHAIIEEMGGWIKFCACKEDDIPFLRNEFTRRYRGYLQQAPQRYPARILGEGGFDDPPKMIGNPQVAEQVMLAGNSSTSGATEISALISQAKRICHE